MLDSNQRQQLYTGELLQFPAGEANSRFVSQLGEALKQPSDDFFPWLTEVRQKLSGELWKARLREFLGGLGVELGEFWVDRFRLRGVAPGSEKVAPTAFGAHRDTWYANPQSQINLWMPLHDVSERNSFTFYPELFQVAVANDSELFDFGQFEFQSSQPGRELVYPHWLEPYPSPSRPVCLRAGEVMLFSAAHLHQSLPNQTDRVRYSIDVRLVHRGDQEDGRGAPNVDNRSRGSALVDYTW